MKLTTSRSSAANMAVRGLIAAWSPHPGHIRVSELPDLRAMLCDRIVADANTKFKAL